MGGEDERVNVKVDRTRTARVFAEPGDAAGQPSGDGQAGQDVQLLLVRQLTEVECSAPADENDASTEHSTARATAIRVSPANDLRIAHDVPIAHVFNKGSFHLDERTAGFLRTTLATGWSVVDIRDEITAKSVAELIGAGLLAPHPAITPLAAKTYQAELADLTVKRHSKFVENMLALISPVLGITTSKGGIIAGLTLYVASLLMTLSLLASDDVLLSWITNPLTTIAIFVPLGLLRGIFHEAGHYAVVAANCSQRPRAGWGVYFTGPALFVDLGALDTSDRGTRLRGDLAGVSVDGYFAALLCLVAVASGFIPLQAATASLVFAILASLNPLTKSDFNWALRDFLGAREMSAAWGRPMTVFRTAKSGNSGAKTFARVALVYYFLFVAVTVIFVSQIYADLLRNGLPEITWWNVTSGAAVVVCLAVALMGISRQRRGNGTR